MKVNPLIFRGYDIRGLVGEDLNEEIVEHIGKAHGTYLTKRGITKAIVGHDSRETSPAYSEAIARGLTWAGVDVIDIGLTLVGTFYWAQHYLKAQGGAYVSASHNPGEYNGFKLANDYSETLVREGIVEVLENVQNETYAQGKKPGKLEKRDVKQEYYNDILKRLPVEKKIKVVIDPSFTTAGALAPDLFRQAGCEVVEKNTKLDPTMPWGASDPTESEVVERLSREVVEAGADIGFTYDSDGDRIGIVDEKGGIIWNDVLVALFALDVLEDHPGATIMFNTLCSKVVPETIIKKGGIPFMWRVGHSFLKKKNQEVKAAFIGELSGHFFFSADFYNHDDGLYSSMRLLRYLSRTNQSLSQAVGQLELYVSSPEIKVHCADDKKVVLMEKISPILKKDYPDAEVIDDDRAGDGIRLELPDGMFVVRYSQNGPYITVKWEGRTQEQYDSLKKYISDLLHQFPEVDWGHKISVNVEALS